MARKQYNDGQEVIFGDQNDEQALHEQELYDRVIKEIIQRVENAFFDDSMFVAFVGATTVSVGPGLGFQEDATVDATEPEKRSIFLASASAHGISAPDGALDRIDVVSIKAARAVTKSETRKFKDEISLVVSDVTLDVENDWVPIITITAGTPAGSPVAPATPAGDLKIAELLVTAVTGIADQSAITDTRSLLPIGDEMLIDSSAFVRTTAAIDTPIKTLLAELDAFVKFGLESKRPLDDAHCSWNKFLKLFCLDIS